ncbi:MAG: arginine deiminase-related protein [Anaerolineae bacterium]|nr:arginine deiminase-related protein [Anaerolineae bacterium]MCO5207421.1 arginine deiminase-related protein [Anaerolineae bacterium]
MTTNISVNHEWGTLKEAVVGTPISMRIPNWSDEYEVVTKEVQQFIKEKQGQLLKDAAPDLFDKSMEQMDAFADLLRSLGVIVHRAAPLTDDEADFLVNFKEGVQQCFTRDPLLVIGNNVIETSMREFERRKERFGIRHAIEERLVNSNANWVSMPQPIPERGTGGYGPGPFLEGGDVLLVGRDIYAGCSGHASNMAGIQWLQRFLGPAYRVHPVPLKRGFLHLDVVLSLPRPGLAIVCRDAFAEGLPDFLDGWDLIDVSVDDTIRLACNGLVLDEKTYICAEEHEHVAEALVKHGQTVHTVLYDIVSLWGGSFRCSHHPLIRESQLD